MHRCYLDYERDTYYLMGTHMKWVWCHLPSVNVGRLGSQWTTFFASAPDMRYSGGCYTQLWDQFWMCHICWGLDPTRKEVGCDTYEL